MSNKTELEQVTEAYASLGEEHAKLGERIKELQEAKNKPLKHKAVAGDVYKCEYACNCLLIEDGKNVILSPRKERLGTAEHAFFDSDPSYEFMGKFEDIYLTRERIKELFMNMRDSDGDGMDYLLAASCGFRLGPEHFDTFISNLLDGKNADGSPADD